MGVKESGFCLLPERVALTLSTSGWDLDSVLSTLGLCGLYEEKQHVRWTWQKLKATLAEEAPLMQWKA